MTGQTDLLKNTKETEIGGATGVGVRILDSQSGEVTLGTPVVITFNNTNSYQELNFKARMESPSKDATRNAFTLRLELWIAMSNHIRPGSPGHIINGLMISGTDGKKIKLTTISELIKKYLLFIIRSHHWLCVSLCR